MSTGKSPVPEQASEETSPATMVAENVIRRPAKLDQGIYKKFAIYA